MSEVAFAMRDASKREVRVKSTNLLVGSFLNKKPYTIVAAKTGTLPQAGHCMAQITRNADGHQVVAVELGGDNHLGRFQDIKALTAWSFDAYEWR
jgi:D-alanyl-D-alanine carboxypeptidase